MGVPGFFGWLVQHCRAALVAARNPQSKVGSKERQETSEGEPELSRTQMDCLYLDMNGIIHPCCHGEAGSPSSEEEMMIRICEKIDEIMTLVRPTQLIYLAIDGTAPRAKMNQQRTRRFRAAQVREIEHEIIQKVKDEWLEAKLQPPSDEDITPWDSNVITPGTPFMEKVAKHLEYYIMMKLSNDPLWQDVTVIFSGSNEPGEGEHKIIQYIKRQRMAPGYNPNTKHCIVGEDADLIMLAMSIHTPYIYILRGARPPRGRERDKDVPKWNYLVISIVMGYFERVFTPVLKDESIPAEKRDLQRMLDDLTLVFCLVGNDFLPHIPGMKIQHNALAVSLLAYVEIFKSLDGYLTDHGEVDLPRLGLLLQKLARNFRTVTDYDADKAAAEEAMKRPPPQPPGLHEIVHMNEVGRRNAFLETVKYHLDSHIERDIEEQKANDTVCVGTVGWEERHYTENFEEFKGEGKGQDGGFDKAKLEQLKKSVSKEYLIGLCWVVAYYFQDCPSWSWYYPYHYSPVLNTIDVSVFESGKVTKPPKAKPYTPFEQLSAVLPEQTAKAVLPKSITKWLTSKKSPLKKYYPKEFHVDLRACPPPWHCTVILPFIQDSVYLPILKKLQKKLTDENDIKRNGRQPGKVYVGKENPAFKQIKKLAEGAFVYGKCYLAAGYSNGAVVKKVNSPFSKDNQLEYPRLTGKEGLAATAELTHPELVNKSVVLEGTEMPDFEERLKPGPLCKKPSFSFQSRIVKAGLPIVLQPGKALDALQSYWASEILPCYHFANYGKCKFGDECRYSHDPEAAKNPKMDENKKRHVGEREGSIDISTPKKQKVEKHIIVVGHEDSTKLYICGGAKMERSALEKYIATRTGVTPERVKWKIPGGKATGTAIVRLSTQAEGEKVFSILQGATLPGSSHPLQIEKSQRAAETAETPPETELPPKTKVKKVVKQAKVKPSAGVAATSSTSPAKKKVVKKKKKAAVTRE